MEGHIAMNWKIDCLYLGKFKVPKSSLTPNLDKDLDLWLPILGFLLRNGKRNILVDTGINKRIIHSGKWGEAPIEAGGEELVVAALHTASVSPRDIETVVYTHLHEDHAGNPQLFPSATHIFQRDEWTALLEPLPHECAQRSTNYEGVAIDEFKHLRCLKVVGNFQLAPEIMCYHIPGHSPGCMALTVSTKSGMYVISTDTVHLKCNLYPQMESMSTLDGHEVKITPVSADFGPAIPPAVVRNYYDWLNSVSLLKAMCESPEFLLTSHDPGIVNNVFL